MAALINKIIKASREIPIEINRFIYNKYPDFVAQDRVSKLENEVPVFMFHTIIPEIFKQQLEYLAVNQYRTLTLAEFMAFLKGDLNLDRPSVLLTFDDGEKSWYDVAYPLLKQYGFHAIGFVVSSFIQEESSSSITATKKWLSWPEVIELNSSGVIEIESHSHYHARIFTEPKLIDFFNPKIPDSLGLDVPWIKTESGFSNKLELGTPLFTASPLLTSKPRYQDDVLVRKACIQWVASHGSEAFFDRPNWRRELIQVFETANSNHTHSPQFLSEEEVHHEILEDLMRSRDVLSNRLNKEITHFCYPWGSGSETAVALSKEVGYQSNFWVELDNRNTNRPGDSPFYIPRLKDDYLLRLPGIGRSSLWKIFQQKLKRRRNSVEIY